MKKAFILICLLALLAPAGALSQGTFSLIPDDALLPAADLATLRDLSTRSLSEPDYVEISGSCCAVLTPWDVGLAFDAPDSSVVVLTRDARKQAALYEAYVTTPIEEVAEAFRARGIHMVVLDTLSGLELFVCVDAAAWTQWYADANHLDEQDQADLLCALLREGWGDPASAAIHRTAANTYFVFHDSARQAASLFTSVGGYRVTVSFAAENGDQLARGLALLEHLTVSCLD